MQFYIGFGPIDNMGTTFEVWVRIWQSASYSNSAWSIVNSFISLYDLTDTYNVELGPGMQGTVNAMYMTYSYLKLPTVLDQNADDMITQRSTWFNSIYEFQPYWIEGLGWGNGILKASLDNTPGEVCDDGNNANGDGWDSTCQIESHWECFVVTDSWVSKCNPKWGNKKLESSEGETCDDGNRANNDGWSNSWIREAGYTFSGGENQLTVATPICGDQMRVPQETWDDNDINDGKGWESDWSGSVRGWSWSSTSPNPSVCTFVLMDGVRAINGEECDDGNSIENDGCSNLGTINSGYTYEIIH